MKPVFKHSCLPDDAQTGMSAPCSLLIIAGEDSGDMHAANVIRELKKRRDDISFWGIGGDKLRAEGVELLHHTGEMDVMGFVEVVKRYPFFKRVLNETVREAEKRKPAAALLVDYPGFNIRLARELKKRGVKILYYICPQVWAWHRGRIPKMAEIIDRLMVIFPFEVDVFNDVDLTVNFVGHPMVNELRQFRTAPAEILPWHGGKKIALLPGSRKQEISHILPALLETARLLKSKYSDVSFIIPVPERRIELVREILRAGKYAPAHIEVTAGNAREVLKQADAALVASGTATLEAALLRCPTILVFKTGALNFALFKMVIRIPWIGIANIIAGREMMPERIQHRMIPQDLAEQVARLMEQTPERTAMLNDFDALEHMLGAGNPAVAVAEIINLEL
ncbi:MAG: lipid-A-disaccharide synthase [Kiritimatiellales bacterium]